MRGVLTLWKRELLLYVRYKSRLIGSLGIPFFFLVSLGFGLQSFIPVGSVSFFDFLVPGIMGMMLLFSGVFSGLSVLTERQFGFLKEMLVAPISRSSIVLGKALGNASTGTIQSCIMLVISILLGFSFNFWMLPLVIATLFLIGLGFIALGVSIASKLSDAQGFQFIVNFLVFPLFLLSGALFPLNHSPQLLQTISLFDPLTYGVDALRGLMVNANVMPLWIDFSVLIGFAVGMTLIAAYLFRKMQ